MPAVPRVPAGSGVWIVWCAANCALSLLILLPRSKEFLNVECLFRVVTVVFGDPEAGEW